MDRNKIVIILLAVGLYFISAGASYLFFGKALSQNPSNSSVPAPTAGADGTLVFDDTLPKTEPCPLNGALYSKQQRQWWEKHRPLGVMVENHENARPQSGVS